MYPRNRPPLPCASRHRPFTFHFHHPHYGCSGAVYKGLAREDARLEVLECGGWIALAVANGVKIAGEKKEGVGARKGSKYPVVDQVTDISVMVGVYAVLGVLEVILGG